MPSGGYDEGYSACQCFWGEHPAEMVKAAVKLFSGNNRYRAIDLGCGEGKNSAALASAGFQVVAIDKSNLAIGNAMRAFPKLDVNWLICDLTEIDGPPEGYDLVIATGSLHCLNTADDVEATIARMQRMTKISGINVLSSFNDGPQDLRGHDRGFMPTLLSHDRYLDLYRDWEIIQVSNKIQTDRHPHNDIEHSHAITRILARRRN